MEFNFKIQNDRLEAIGSPSGVTGNINTYVCNFDITCNISDLIWFCVFKQGTKVYDKIMETNACLIPYEVLTNPEPLYIGCFGKKADGEIKQVSTNMVYFDLKQGAYEVGDIPAEPPEDAYTILLKSLKAPYIGENGNWYEWDVETLTYVDSGVSAKGSGGEAVSDEQIQEAVDKYLEENPVEVDLTGYVKEEDGKGLSSNDFTDELKEQLEQSVDDVNEIISGETTVPYAEEAMGAWEAETAYFDADGNDIVETYATKYELENYSEKIYISDEVEVEPEGDNIKYILSEWNNSEMRVTEHGIGKPIIFTISDGVYPSDYTSGLVFDTGETETMLVYTENSRILHWVGTDCSITDGLSIFSPQPNTHYDIVFYFNGTCFVGLVNGYKFATANQ